MTSIPVPIWSARLLPAVILAAGLAGAIPLAARAAEPPAAAAPAGAAGPSVQVQEMLQDGGTVEQGTVLRYRFTLVNRGAADLEITRVQPSCGCTAPRWDRVIAPGKEGVIEAELNTSSFRGPVKKYLAVFTNDPAQAQIALTMTAVVQPLLEVKPRTSALLVMADEPVSHEFTLERTGGKPMQIRQVTTRVPYLKTEVTPLSGDGRYRLVVTATAETPMGYAAVPVIVQTDLEKNPRVTLIVSVERGIISRPPRLYWSLTGSEDQRPVKSAITLSRRQGQFHVTGVAADDPKLETKLETVRDGQEYRVFIAYNGGWDGGVVKKTLTITTDDPNQPEIKIPIQATSPALPAAARVPPP